MPILPHEAPIIILPEGTDNADATALAAVLDQHGARQILRLTRAALEFGAAAPLPPAPAAVDKAKSKSKTQSRANRPAPTPPGCSGITRSGLPCRRGPRCKMHQSLASEPKPTDVPIVPDNAPGAPPTDEDDTTEPEPPASAAEPINEPAAGASKTRRCPHCKADGAMMETIRLPGNLIEVKCHACGYRKREE